MYTLIIVDYNSIEKTIEYIRKCRENLDSKEVSHIVIVENGDKGDLVVSLCQAFGEYRTQMCPNVGKAVFVFQSGDHEIVYCDSGANLGFAKGNNLGVRISVDLWDDRYYIFSNTDLEFPRKMDLSIVTELFEQNPNIGLIGPQVRSLEGEQQSPRKHIGAIARLILRYWIPFTRFLWGQKNAQKLWDKCCNNVVDNAPNGAYAWIMGCFMIARKESFFQVGMFDEHTFLYAEEAILSKRLENSGFVTYFCNEIELLHERWGQTKQYYTNLKIQELEFESNSYFYKTYMHTPRIWLGLAGVLFKWYVAYVMWRMRRKEKKHDDRRMQG